MAIAEKDSRLYMTFPIDFHRHPKVDRLTVEQKWAFVEMNGEARIADNDGVFSAEDAEFMWGRETLDALVNSHPSRPLLVRRGETYVIREYAKHQHTKADREAVSLRKSEAGKKGAEKRWQKHGRGMAGAKQVPSTSQAGAKQVDGKTCLQSQSQSQSQDLLLTESVTLGSNRAREDETDSAERRQGSERLAAAMGLDLGKVIEAASRIERELDHGEALRLSTIIIAKAPTEPDSATAYVLGAFKRSPFEVQQVIDTEVMT